MKILSKKPSKKMSTNNLIQLLVENFNKNNVVIIFYTKIAKTLNC